MPKRSKKIKSQRIHNTIHAWQEYSTQGHPPQVPLDNWGKDHWSTLGYLVSRVTGCEGLIDNRRMRCNSRVHREFAHMMSSGSGYPTITKHGEVERHDDWSCLEDMVSLGLLKAWFRIKDAEAVFGGCEAKVELTDLGWKVARLLTEHKAKGEGHTFSNFTLPLDLALLVVFNGSGEGR